MQHQPPFTPTNPRMPFYQGQQNTYPGYQPNANPYSYFQKPPIPMQNVPFHTNSQQKPKQNPLLGYFQTDKGEMDMDKVFHTVNQLASTYQQVSPLVKNVGNFIKTIQK
ncbi:hypothetical protein GGQ92_001899 [Gracilibacillus halotolerans]|uniref:YppG-like protein n=1 Tax=Gracilibacillus halotolerans TaxID=74386 RepID=A0A841RKU1_9BACI|nr:YppG family protein [Gracilibacillus halotolerans]MBB6513109.1 hypothetical protein [Gracilibacillus halotolerans]